MNIVMIPQNPQVKQTVDRYK